uniref:Uncharacterized protein n=1 Tax=Talaromyces marneffei PM1 TaxID=1077442 RepID=A0A093VUH4_TALMA
MATSRYRSTRGQEVYLSDAQLAWKLNQTLTYSMLPIDIRVWDAFLFSTFTDANGAPTLVRIYIGLIMQGHTATDILKWCKEGTLVNHAVEILTPWVATQNGELVRKDLLFLVENSAALTDWNQRLSSFDGSTARGRWTTQAMWCVMAGKPPGRDANADIEWLKRRNALFAWGVAIWRIPPDPIWVVYDPNLDVYHDLGYVVATTPAWAGSLRNEYHARFGYDKMGIPRADNFEEFYGIWQTQSFLRYFNPNWATGNFAKISRIFSTVPKVEEG